MDTRQEITGSVQKIPSSLPILTKYVYIYIFFKTNKKVENSFAFINSFENKWNFSPSNKKTKQKEQEK